MNLWFMRWVNERERTIWQFVIVKYKLTSVFNASVLLLTINFVITCQSSLQIHSYLWRLHNKEDNYNYRILTAGSLFKILTYKIENIFRLINNITVRTAFRLLCRVKALCSFSCFRLQPCSLTKKPPHFLIHCISQREKISSLRDTLSNGLILPVCYRATNNVWETLGVLLQTTRCHPRRTAKELVNWTSTTSPSSIKRPTFTISKGSFSLCCW